MRNAKAGGQPTPSYGGMGGQLGPRLFARAPDRSRRHLGRAQALVRRFGGSAALLGRWTAVLGALVPSVAGASGLHYRRFVLFNLAGGTLWGGPSLAWITSPAPPTGAPSGPSGSSGW
jgi:membrane protein DedA with SNARE-associated domain